MWASGHSRASQSGDPPKLDLILAPAAPRVLVDERAMPSGPVVVDRELHRVDFIAVTDLIPLQGAAIFFQTILTNAVPRDGGETIQVHHDRLSSSAGTAGEFGVRDDILVPG
jgi:hypothetical protein